MSDEYDFIVEHGGKPFLESGGSGQYVALEAVFEQYRDEDNTAQDVADMFQIREEDVHNGILYWTSEPDVYAELVESVEQSSSDDAIEASAESPFMAAKRGFKQIFEYSDSPVSEEDIDSIPQERALGGDTVETHMYWRMNDSDLAVYTAWHSEGLDTGLVSFSVDGDQGPVLEVDTDELEKRVQEMYRNAVFASRDS